MTRPQGNILPRSEVKKTKIVIPEPKKHHSTIKSEKGIEFILSLLQDGPLPPHILMKLTDGMPERTVNTYIGILKKQKKIEVIQCPHCLMHKRIYKKK